MNPSKFSPEDPKLTAYALGELEANELAEIEARLREDPAARAAVDEIRAMAKQLEAALAAEPAPEVNPVPVSQRAAIVPGRDPAKLDGGPLRALVLKFPQFYYVAGTLMAACLIMLVTLHRPRETPERGHRAEEATMRPLKKATGKSVAVTANRERSEPVPVEQKASPVMPTEQLGAPVANRSAMTPVAKDALEARRDVTAAVSQRIAQERDRTADAGHVARPQPEVGDLRHLRERGHDGLVRLQALAGVVHPHALLMAILVEQGK